MKQEASMVAQYKVHCGSSKKPEVAARLYDAKARELFGETAVTNFPLDHDQTED